jgi:hypothetical protein
MKAISPAGSLGVFSWLSPLRHQARCRTRKRPDIGNCFEVSAGTDPTNPGDPPPPPPNDFTPPYIFLTLPTGATQLP